MLPMQQIHEPVERTSERREVGRREDTGGGYPKVRFRFITRVQSEGRIRNSFFLLCVKFYLRFVACSVRFIDLLVFANLASATD